MHRLRPAEALGALEPVFLPGLEFDESAMLGRIDPMADHGQSRGQTNSDEDGKVNEVDPSRDSAVFVTGHDRGRPRTAIPSGR